MRHLQDGNANCHVVGSPKILALIVLQVLLFDVEEQLSVKCSQMAGIKGSVSIAVLFYHCYREGARVADSTSDGQEIGVDKPSPLLLENRVEQFQNLPAK